MSMKQFYMSMIQKGMMTENESLIREYEEKLQEELRKEYVKKTKPIKAQTMPWIYIIQVLTSFSYSIFYSHYHHWG